jgi:hypothetical protein
MAAGFPHLAPFQRMLSSLDSLTPLQFQRLLNENRLDGTMPSSIYQLNRLSHLCVDAELQVFSLSSLFSPKVRVQQLPVRNDIGVNWTIDEHPLFVRWQFHQPGSIATSHVTLRPPRALSANQFVGPIPSSIGLLTALTELCVARIANTSLPHSCRFSDTCTRIASLERYPLLLPV